MEFFTEYGAILIIMALPLNFFITEELLKMDFSGLHYFIFVYYMLMVFFIQMSMLGALKNRPQKFVIAFMSSMGIKIFASLTLLVIVMYTGLNDTKVFAINFLILYLLFSGFSIYQIQKAHNELTEKK